MEASNEISIASSYVIVKHLVSLMLASYGVTVMYDVSQMAFDTLVNIGTRFDLGDEY